MSNSKQNNNQNNNHNNHNSNHKWINQLRLLPSKPNSNDFLKLEYLEVNLNNSRKLINNLNELSKNTNDYLDNLNLQVNGNLVQIKHIEKELDWLPK
ncbi:unnamed protein product [Candida verbasci]|uniref:Uncharacterized protein n=1 Tax=Candida verbasci TaxID=1227364 RepID=A0A9W4TW47_9ASCO|nr:unnamed protein product [Candida verbasci]